MTAERGDEAGITALGLGVAVACARSALRRIAFDVGVRLVFVLMLAVAGSLLVFAAYAFAETFTANYVAALLVSAAVAIGCAGLYAGCIRPGKSRKHTPQRRVETPEASAGASIELTVKNVSQPGPSSIELAVLAGLAAGRLYVRARGIRHDDDRRVKS